VSEANGGAGTSVRADLEERLGRYTKDWERERASSLRLGWVRVGTFLAGATLYVTADVTEGSVSLWAWGGLGLAFILFMVEVIWHRKIRARERWLGALVRVNMDALNRMERRWDTLPCPGFEDPPTPHPYALDLDLSGKGSLFHLLTTVTLPPGIRTLRAWLLEPAHAQEVRLRQGGVEELARKLDLRQAMEATGRMVDPPSPEAMGDSWPGPTRSRGSPTAPGSGLGRFSSPSSRHPWSISTSGGPSRHRGGC
jgi:hypothetical protein